MNVQRLFNRARGRAERGAVAIMVGLSMFVLVGSAGLALDLGRLYVNKSELQTAADACALAAAAALTCTSGSTGCLTNAQYAGQFAGSQNKNDFQGNAVSIAAADVRFSTSFVPDSGYLAVSGGPAATSTFALCIARSAGITPWLMGVLGVGQQLVTAQAVASLQPAGSGGFCPSAPIAVCPPAGGGSYSVGDWVGANLNGNGANTGGVGSLKGTYASGAIKGTFQWTVWSPPGGGSTTSLRDELAGAVTACGATSGQTVTLDTGNHQGAKDAWNSRFGIYSNGNGGYSVTTAPPDFTGFSFPTSSGSWPTSYPTPGFNSAYSTYRTNQATGVAYQGTSGSSGYSPQGQGNPQVQAGTQTTTAQDLAYGTNRRMITAAVVASCSGTSTTVSSFGCFLMLDPMSNGQNGDNFLEYRGLASAAGSPCSQPGTPGGTGGTGGAMVPTLVQ